MFSISTENLGKKFNYEWIFKNLSFKFQLGDSYAIVGNNGSGKSTMLQVLAGALPPSEGKIWYEQENKKILPEEFYQYLSWASPYLELIEEMTLTEQIEFHFKMKPRSSLISSNKQLIELLRLEQSKKKYIKNFSSGMKQRLKLGLAFYTDTPLLMLDEPTSNLDAQNIAWYKNEVTKQIGQRLIIVASNQNEEYDFCKHIIRLQ
ncbi:MAG: ATP-binding cassette domain-containing protein [Raineya sp.]